MIQVAKGTTVTWTNQDPVPHTVTFSGFGSGSLDTGGTYSHTFSDAGMFPYHCSIHPSMNGAVVVQ